jgi:hypothetical protein
MGRAFSKLTNSVMSLSLAIGFSLAASPLAMAADECVAGFTLVDGTCQISYTHSLGVKSLTVPQGLGRIEIEVFGAAGGAGGLDGGQCARSFSGDVGYLVLTYPDLSNQKLTFYPGEKGKDGATNARGSGGGLGGSSLLSDQYNGGRGGNTGPIGSSGGGGGGGAATVIDVEKERFIAAGGGAGGGCANSVNGSTYGSTNQSYTETSNGGQGTSTTGNPYSDGGGGGGGGAGILGGTGGLLYKAAGNESAGFGGNAGTSSPVGTRVAVSTYIDSNTDGRVIVKYFPILGTKSLEVVSNNSANNCLLYTSDAADEC